MVRYSSVNNKIFKKGIILLLLIAVMCICSYQCMGKSTAEASKGSSSVVIEATTYRVLKGSNIHMRLPMASTTKAMTALIAIENNKLDTVVTIPKKAVGIEGSSIYLVEGEKLTIKELLYGLMLTSGNDAATALALHTAGTIENFCSMMNKKVKDLGLCNTNFANPHGLSNEQHYTSAYDLAVISSFAMSNSTFKEITNTKNVVINGANDTKRYLHNKNKILSIYKGGNGIKTGFTKDAGRCLIASSEREGMQVVSVVLNIPPMFEECCALMDYAHQNYMMKKVVDKDISIGNIAVKKSTIMRTAIYSDKDVIIPIKKDGSEKVELLSNMPDFILAPHKKTKNIGDLQIKIDNHLIFSSKLYSIEDIKERGVLDHFKNLVKNGRIIKDEDK